MTASIPATPTEPGTELPTPVAAARVKRVLLASPRGYCAGVDRAVSTVEKALETYGAPLYVRKEIVHNRHVVDTLARRGVIFVDENGEGPGVRLRKAKPDAAAVIERGDQARAAARAWSAERSPGSTLGQKRRRDARAS